MRKKESDSGSGDGVPVGTKARWFQKSHTCVAMVCQLGQKALKTVDVKTVSALEKTFRVYYTRRHSKSLKIQRRHPKIHD